MIGAVERVGDGLIDRHRDGLGRRLGVVAAVDGDRFAFHVFTAACSCDAPRRHVSAYRSLFLIGWPFSTMQAMKSKAITLIVNASSYR